MTRFLKAAALAATFAMAPVLAGAATILPIGDTTVEVTAPLADLGLGGGPLGTAGVDVNDAGNPVFSFAITGGTITEDGAVIEHDGSGVELFALEEEDDASEVFVSSGVTLPAVDDEDKITAENFVIDTVVGTVFGNVNGGPDPLALFTLGDADENGIELLITDVLAGALTDVFGAPDLEGAVFGLASTSPVAAPAAVPLPAGFALLLSGFGLLAMRRRFA